MAVLIAGDAGSVVVAAALESRPLAGLALEWLAAPTSIRGVPALPIGDLDAAPSADAVELLTCEAPAREAMQSWAARRGIPVRHTSVELLEPPAGVRCLSVEAATTGSGKTLLAAKLARSLSRSGARVAVVRNPLPNGGLEVSEELAAVRAARVPATLGDDPRSLFESIDARVVVWDGGGASEPWIRPDVRVVAVDLLRDLPDDAEPRIRAADAVVLTKADTAEAVRARRTEDRIRDWNPEARLFLTDMPVAVPGSAALTGRDAVVVEDAPSLLLGGLRAGAGAVAARRFRCRVVDPRRFAIGAIAEALAAHPWVGAVIPTLGRTPSERADLRASILATPGDVVLWASPADPAEVIPDEPREILRAYPEIIETAGGSLQDVIRPLLPGESGPIRIRRR